MTAPSAREIEAAALASLAAFPTVARFVQAQDPRVLAPIRAQAAMLAMLAEQIDNAQFEPFVKSRDSTVLADATLKGVLPLARSCRVSLSVTNNDTAPFTMTANRLLLDPKGRVFMVDSDVIIAAGATALVAATQRTTRTIAHTVTAPTPFYRVEVSPGDDTGTYITTLQVIKDGTEFSYMPDWFNVQPGDLFYQVETDERRRLLVCMGATDIVGYGVVTGDQFAINVTECEGKVEDLQQGAAFGMQYILTVADGRQDISLDSVTDTGAAPPTVSDLRVIARYPSIYDHNAVYLGEFDMMLRRYITGIRFLSVWNEQIEEQYRGPNEDNINTLFVSGLVDGMTDAAFQARASELIARADDSYGIKFVPAVVSAIPVAITGQIAVVHDKATVEAQIRGAILASYAAGSSLVSSGMSNPLRVQAITKLLKDSVAAFQDDVSDFSVTVTLGSAPLPEHFVQVTNASLSVTLTNANHNGGLWNR